MLRILGLVLAAMLVGACAARRKPPHVGSQGSEVMRASGGKQWPVVLAVILTVAACGSPNPSPSPSLGTAPAESVPNSEGTEPSLRKWTITVHSLQEQTEAELEITDATGLVTGARETVQPSFGFGGRSVHLGFIPGDDRSLAVFVAVAGCQRQPNIAMSRTGTGLLVRLDPGPRAAGGCDAMSVEYGVVLSLSNPVALADLVTQDVDADAVTWGVPSLGTDGTTMPLLIIDRTKGTIAAAAAVPDMIALGGDDVVVSNPLGDIRTLMVAWTRDSCETDTTLTIDESEGLVGLSIQLARVGTEICGSENVAHAITLQFATAVPADAVSASVTHNQ